MNSRDNTETNRDEAFIPREREIQFHTFEEIRKKFPAPVHSLIYGGSMLVSESVPSNISDIKKDQREYRKVTGKNNNEKR